ncbi:FUSC family protein [Thermodesulfovibrionales bacterium]|nr:FUSC family protein [Thermodesulfovibrionales bacterium]
MIGIEGILLASVIGSAIALLLTKSVKITGLVFGCHNILYGFLKYSKEGNLADIALYVLVGAVIVACYFYISKATKDEEGRPILDRMLSTSLCLVVVAIVYAFGVLPNVTALFAIGIITLFLSADLVKIPVGIGFIKNALHLLAVDAGKIPGGEGSGYVVGISAIILYLVASYVIIGVYKEYESRKVSDLMKVRW